MNNDLILLGEMILEKKYEIAQALHEDRLSGVQMTEQEKRDFKKLEAHIIDIRANFIGLFGEALIEHTDQQKTFDKILQWGKETGEYFFNLGAPLDEALKDTSYYRIYIWEAIEKEATLKKMSASTIFKVISIIDPVLDRAVYSFSLSYVEFHQKTLENAKSAFLELSVPVVPLTKGVGVLPLIGNVDTERARLLMEETLKRSAELKLSHLILDISGVMLVDTMVADQLFKVIDALALTGVKTIITGIRPEVAQTMVSLGLKLDGLMVKANLQQAFDEIQLVKRT
ncbi:STAS domain-containing protein [Neobacillus sp. PS3-34]|uniref:STAS domain-containing protein n=1 Tax=Neobacillus sp. PS3-34 TaxID=3070678 RepID=UPI0027E12AFF|nr:STAS domain-containing protein [Neobacillus sp. PS3-34]WML50069.1 STAS domain-containing protein [Neobacillus sp. PS3-34]